MPFPRGAYRWIRNEGSSPHVFATRSRGVAHVSTPGPACPRSGTADLRAPYRVPSLVPRAALSRVSHDEAGDWLSLPPCRIQISSPLRGRTSALTTPRCERSPPISWSQPRRKHLPADHRGGAAHARPPGRRQEDRAVFGRNASSHRGRARVTSASRRRVPAHAAGRASVTRSSRWSTWRRRSCLIALLQPPSARG